MIYHLVTTANWTAQLSNPVYEAASLANEGFIHLSTKHQIRGVWARYYRHVPDLLLLHIDPAKLTAELRYEAATNNELFPHLYGPLNIDAVISVDPFEGDAF